MHTVRLMNLVPSDPLFHFVLLLQFCMPTAINVGELLLSNSSSHTSFVLSYVLVLRATSHMSQGPWPCNSEALDSHPKVVSLTWSVGICIMHTNWRWAKRKFWQTMKYYYNLSCRNPCRLFIQDDFFGPLGLHFLLWRELGWSPPFRPMRDLRIQCSWVFVSCVKWPWGYLEKFCGIKSYKIHYYTNTCINRNLRNYVWDVLAIYSCKMNNIEDLSLSLSHTPTGKGNCWIQVYLSPIQYRNLMPYKFVTDSS